MGRKSLPQRRQIYDNGFTSSQVRTTLILLYHKLLKKCNTFNPIICKSKKKTNLFCFLTTFFKTARFEHENEMQRKALKHTQKTLESSPFGNPESSTRNPESTVWESRIQDSPGFPYMGRKYRYQLDSLKLSRPKTILQP